jgi:DNA-binding beta-propeller fold protein YncE
MSTRRSGLSLAAAAAFGAWVVAGGSSPAQLVNVESLENLTCAYAAEPAQEYELPGLVTYGGTPMGGDMSPARVVKDAYSTTAGLAVDPVNGDVVMSDENRFSLMVYDRAAEQTGVAEIRRRIAGPRTKIEFICGVAIDPVTRDIYTVNSDTLDNMIVFSHDQQGDVAPARELKVDHGAWGIALDRKNDEVVITTQHLSKIAAYRRTASGDEKALRAIEGPRTGLADAHGVFVDTDHDEIVVSSQGAWKERLRQTPDERAAQRRGELTPAERLLFAPFSPSTGRFFGPSVRIFARTANGDVAPLRIFEGPKTRLNLPQGIAVDMERNLIAVANDGTHEILFFDRTATGDVAPLYSLGGPATGIVNPSGVWIDTKHNEIWVSNWGDHSATVYPRDARGNVAPLRSLRTAPRRTPTPGLGNPSAVTYDSKRDQLLVPN